MKPFSRIPVAVRQMVADRRRIVIRLANGVDQDALAALAALSERSVPAVPLLLAEADGALIAALSRRTGEVVTDPFVATEDVVGLLRFRSAQLDAAA